TRYRIFSYTHPAATEIYSLSLHDALPISSMRKEVLKRLAEKGQQPYATVLGCSDSRVPVELLFDAGFGELFVIRVAGNVISEPRSEEHTSELQSLTNLVCRLLLEKKRQTS